MLRRSTFRRPERPARVRTLPAPIAPENRRGTYARCDAPAVAAPKSEPKRNPHLLAMAQGRSCALRIPGVCNGDCETTVAAHSNFGIHGKAKGRKADDAYHVHSCSACHVWLDQGPADKAIKELAFMRAHLWMVDRWRGIVAGFTDASPADIRAAQWALDQLNATPAIILK